MITENPLWVTEHLKIITAPRSHSLDNQLQLIIPKGNKIEDYPELDNIPLTLKITNFGSEHGLDAKIQDSFLNLSRDQQIEIFKYLQTQKSAAQANVSVTIKATDGDRQDKIQRILASFLLSS